jgi:hypothetical protein
MFQKVMQSAAKHLACAGWMTLGGAGEMLRCALHDG